MQVRDEGIAQPILLGRPERIRGTIDNLGLNFEAEAFDHYDADNQYDYRDMLYDLRRRKGVTRGKARSLARQRNYYASLMVKNGDADAMVSGLTYEYPDVIRPALQVFRHARRRDASGRRLFDGDRRAQLPFHRRHGQYRSLIPRHWRKSLFLRTTSRIRWALIRGWRCCPSRISVPRPIRKATRFGGRWSRCATRRPDIVVDGEMQADTAVVIDIIEDRYPFSQVRDANVLVFPNLDAANISYKLLSRLTNAEAIGPILLGMGMPVHVLQAGDDVEDIVAIAAVAAVDAHGREG